MAKLTPDACCPSVMEKDLETHYMTVHNKFFVAPPVLGIPVGQGDPTGQKFVPLLTPRQDHEVDVAHMKQAIVKQAPVDHVKVDVAAKSAASGQRGKVHQRKLMPRWSLLNQRGNIH